MSKQQRDAIDVALRAEPFGLSQSTAEHRKSFEAFALHPNPADVATADVALGGVGTIELTVAGSWLSAPVETTSRSGRAGFLPRHRRAFGAVGSLGLLRDDRRRCLLPPVLAAKVVFRLITGIGNRAEGGGPRRGRGRGRQGE